MAENVPYPYDLTNEELAERFMQLCMEAGAKAKGAFIDIDNAPLLNDANYFRGAILARLDGKVPPFKPSQIVITKDRRTATQIQLWDGHLIKPGETVTVERTSYRGNSKWILKFRSITCNGRVPLYDAEDFIRLPLTPDTLKA